MNDSIYRISLDIHDTGSQTSLSAKKGDKYRSLHITLTENGKPYKIAEGCYACFEAKKPDNNFIHNACEIKGNTIIYGFTTQTTAAVGRVDCEITLYDSELCENKITSPRFSLEIEDTVYNGEEIVSSSEADALKGLIKETNELINDVETKLENGDFIGEQGIQGIQGEQGVSGVYVGSGEMPEGYNVQIDPDSDVVPMAEGISEKSLVFNDAQGNIAGSYAYEIVSVDFGNKRFTLKNANGIKEALSAETTLQYSCQLNQCYDLYGHILSVNGNVVTVDVIPIATTTIGVLWIPSHPELGDGETIIGTGAFVIGEGNIAGGYNAFASGADNISGGKCSATFGQHNFAGYNAFVANNMNKATGTHAAVFGNGNEATGESTFVTGILNKTTGNGQFVTGVYCKDDPNKIFIVGNGMGDANRHNALTVSKDGRVACGQYSKEDLNALFVVGNGISDANRKNLFTVLNDGKIVLNESSVIRNGDKTDTLIFSRDNGNVNKGVYGTLFGITNKVYSPLGFANGFNCVAGDINDVNINDPFSGQLSSRLPIAMGWGVTSKGLYTTAFGNSTIASGDSQFVCGKYNKEDANALFIVGGGSPSAKKNLFVVTQDDVKHNGLTLATKNYVDSKEESGTWTPYVNTIDGVQFTFSNSKYYKVGKLINIQTTVVINFEGAAEDSTEHIFKDNGGILGVPFVCDRTTKTTASFGSNTATATIDRGSIYLGASYFNDVWETMGYGQINKSTLYKSTYGKSSGSIQFDINITYRQG